MGKQKRKYKQQITHKENTNKDYSVLEIATFFVALVSLFVAIASSAVSYDTQNKSNYFTQSMSPLNYDFVINENPETITYEDTTYSLTPFKISKSKDEISGEYESCYLATVNNMEIDLFDVENNDLSNNHPFWVFNNDSLIYLLEPIIDEERNTITLYLSVGYEKNWSMIHIILKGFNGEKYFYSLVYGYGNNDRVIGLLLSDEDIYNRSNISSFIYKLKEKTLDTDALINKIEDERSLLKEKLS